MSTLAVFVPTAIGAGIVASLALGITDLLGQLRSERQRRRSVEILATSTAATAMGASTDAASRVGVRSRRLAAVAGLVVGGLGVYGLMGSFWNFWNPVDTFNEAGWMWALSWALSALFLGTGLAALSIALGRPLTGLARALVVKTPLGEAPVDGAAVAVSAREPAAEGVLGGEQHRGADEQTRDDV